jgi:hypothetical protein
MVPDALRTRWARWFYRLIHHVERHANQAHTITIGILGCNVN